MPGEDETGLLRRVAVDGRSDTFIVGLTEDVVALRVPQITGVRFSITPDGEKVLAAVNLLEEQSPFVDLVVGWPQELENQ